MSERRHDVSRLETFSDGFIYGLMGPLHAWNGFAMGRATSVLKPHA
jgi:hypothetical protein